MTVRVVLADDVEPLRRLVRVVLERSGLFEIVGEAGDGKEALTVVGSTLPDLVLLDLSMPRMDGLESLREMRKRWPDLRIVLFSGFTADRMQSVGEKLGAVDYIEKGAAPDVLVERLLAASGIAHA